MVKRSGIEKFLEDEERERLIEEQVSKFEQLDKFEPAVYFKCREILNKYNGSLYRHYLNRVENKHNSFKSKHL